MLFIDIEQPRRNDHVFMRTLDFFGAGPGPLLTADWARSIAGALNALVSFSKRSVHSARVGREKAKN